MHRPNFINNAEVGGKVWLFWDDEPKFELVAMSDQALSGWFICGNIRVMVTIVYASCFWVTRLELWDHICGLDMGSWPAFFGGGF